MNPAIKELFAMLIVTVSCFFPLAIYCEVRCHKERERMRDLVAPILVAAGYKISNLKVLDHKHFVLHNCTLWILVRNEEKLILVAKHVSYSDVSEIYELKGTKGRISLVSGYDYRAFVTVHTNVQMPLKDSCFYGWHQYRS